jgi:hypothetical protein
VLVMAGGCGGGGSTSAPQATKPVTVAQVRACLGNRAHFQVGEDRNVWPKTLAAQRDGFDITFPDSRSGGFGSGRKYYVIVAVMPTHAQAAALFTKTSRDFDLGLTPDYAYAVSNVFLDWNGESSAKHPKEAAAVKRCITNP